MTRREDRVAGRVLDEEEGLCVAEGENCAEEGCEASASENSEREVKRWKGTCRDRERDQDPPESRDCANVDSQPEL